MTNESQQDMQHLARHLPHRMDIKRVHAITAQPPWSLQRLHKPTHTQASQELRGKYIHPSVRKHLWFWLGTIFPEESGFRTQEFGIKVGPHYNLEPREVTPFC